jgi:3-hydroxyisobutyrate dehydrogenase
LRPGGLWIDHSTTDYNQTLEFAELCAAKEQLILEAPITGGLTLLLEGKMTVFVGGDEQVLRDHRPLFDASFKNVIYLGKIGNATITKVVTNMLAGANTCLAGEALLIAKKTGIDLSAYFDAVRASAGNSYVWETEVPLAFNGTYDPGFHIDLHCKDLNLGYEIARGSGVPLPIFSQVEQTYFRAMQKYGRTAGSSIPMKMYADDADTSFSESGYDDWTYTCSPIEQSSAERVPGMAVVHQADESKSVKSKAKNRTCDRE